MDDIDFNIDPDDIIDDGFELIVKSKKDIIEEIEFKNEEDKLLCESIIDGIDRLASKEIRNLKTVNIPFIGCVRINPVKHQLINDSKNYSIIRKNTTKKEYREYVKEHVIELIQKQRKLDKEKLVFKNIRKNNKKKYDTLYKRLGRAYAEMYIFSLSLMSIVSSDSEWEEHYQSLKD